MLELLENKDYRFLVCYCVELHKQQSGKSGIESYHEIRDIFMPQIDRFWRACTHDFDGLPDMIKSTFEKEKAK